MKKLTTEQWVQQAKEIHGDKFNYINTVYSTAKTRLDINCPEHGLQNMLPHHHLKGYGCGVCGKKQINISNGNQITQEEFIRRGKLVSENLTFERTIYKSKREDVIITCKLHGDYISKAEMILKGCGCPKCTISKGEQEVEKWLISKGIEYITQKTFKDCVYKKQLPFDFYLPAYNLCIEYDGKQHYQSVEFFGGQEGFQNRVLKDIIKDNFCRISGIQLLRISYTQDIIRTLENNINNLNKRKWQ